MGRGLTEGELETISAGLAAGRRPRVQFTESAGQIAGQIGQVVSLLDPAAGDEWVVVRFGRDELPFSPADLQVAPKGAAARKVVPPPEPPAPRAEPEFLIDKPLPPRKGVAAARAGGAATVGDVDSPADPAPLPAPAAPAPRKASRPARPKSPPGLTVTLSYDAGEWTVAAAQGSKALAKPYLIKPAEALRMVALVDVPGVQEAVEQIVSAERAEAEQQAERLRAELAEIEARLAELRDVG